MAERKRLTVDQVFPVGMVTSFLGFVAPEGWLLCDGSWVSESEYSALYSVIGDVYDYASEKAEHIGLFKLPDLRGRFLEGTPNNGTTGTSVAAGLPEIQGYWAHRVNGADAAASGAFTETATTNVAANVSSSIHGGYYIYFKASNSNSIYGNSTTVQPPAVLVNFIVKT